MLYVDSVVIPGASNIEAIRELCRGCGLSLKDATHLVIHRDGAWVSDEAYDLMLELGAQVVVAGFGGGSLVIEYVELPT